jgi:hypothetical protein
MNRLAPILRTLSSKSHLDSFAGAAQSNVVGIIMKLTHMIEKGGDSDLGL